MNRLYLALAAFGVLGALSWTTISDSRIRAATLAILGMFAFRTWVRRKDVMHSGHSAAEDTAEVGEEPSAVVDE